MSIRRFVAYLAVLLGALCFCTPPLFAGDGGMRLEAVLVWATNVQKTNDANLKELEAPIAKKLHKAYKWENYYEVRRKQATISGKDATKVPISEKCALEVKHLGEERFEVRLIGKGKPVSRSVESLAHGHLMILGGDDKNDTAWLIVIRQVSSKK